MFAISKCSGNYRDIPLTPLVSCGSRERRVVSHLRNDNHKFQPTYSIMGHKRVHQPSPPLLMPHLSLSVSGVKWGSGYKQCWQLFCEQAHNISSASHPPLSHSALLHCAVNTEELLAFRPTEKDCRVMLQLPNIAVIRPAVMLAIICHYLQFAKPGNFGANMLQLLRTATPHLAT